LEIDSGLVLTAGSLAVRHLGSDTHMHIDAATAAALELIHPIRVGTCSAKRSGMSLFRCGGDAAVFVGAASSGPGSMAVAFCAYFKLARRALWVLAKSCRMRQRCKPTHTALHTYPCSVICLLPCALPPCRVLDRTKTKCGARLLRANLLQPLRDIGTLTLRYDCLEELLQDDELAFNVAACLKQLPKDLDK
jgi:hypothetical protein